MPEKTTFKDSALRALAVLGLIAILLLGAWGIIQIAFAIPGFFGNLGENYPTSSTNSGKEILAVTAPASATGGSPFTLSWSHQNASGNYGYAVEYSCAPGLTMQAPVATGGVANAPCNTPFNFTNATQNIQLTPVLSGKNQVSTMITVLANDLSSGQVTTTGTSTLTIAPKGGSTATMTQPSYPVGSYVPAPVQTKPTLYGEGDLAVSIVAAPQVSSGRASVQFVIQNIGTNVVPGGWTFSAEVPQDGSGSYTYASPAQQKLFPGDKIVYTLGFTLPTPSYNYTQPSTYYPYTTYPTGYGNSPYPATCAYAQSYSYNGSYTYPSTGYGCSSQYQYPYNYQTYNPSYGSNYPTSNYYSNQNYTFSVTADPLNLIPEISKVNNTASVPLVY